MRMVMLSAFSLVFAITLFFGCASHDTDENTSELEVMSEKSIYKLSTIGFKYFSDPKSKEHAWHHLRQEIAKLNIESTELFSGKAVEMRDDVLLEAALYCMKYELYVEADFFINALEKKSDKGMVLALEAKALIADRLEEYEDAAKYWKALLQRVPEHKAARVNYGLLLTRFGHFEEALEILHPMEGIEEVDIAMLVGFRHVGHKDQADRLCAQLSSSRNHLVPFNCSLHHFQGHRDSNKAIDLMNTALRSMPKNHEDYKVATILLEEMKAFRDVHQQ